MRIVAIIPARYLSTRLPGKPLKDIDGKLMIQRVYDGVCRSEKIQETIVATDDARIEEHVTSFGGKAMLTKSNHENGTSRAAEVAERIEADFIIIVQGDEPMIYTEAIESLIAELDYNIPVYSLMHEIEEGIDTRERAKVMTDLNGFAITFSRSRIPYNFNNDPIYYKGVGVYAFRKDFLLNYLQLPMGPVEAAEGIELLRVIEHGHKVKMIKMSKKVQCVDTQNDLDVVIEAYKNGYSNY